MRLFSHRKDTATTGSHPAHGPLLTRPPYEYGRRRARFVGGEVIGDHAVLGWRTVHGGVLLGHPLSGGSSGVQAMAGAVQSRYGPDVDEDVAAVVVGEEYWVNGPRLTAVDLLPGEQVSTPYHPTFHHLYLLLGTRAPWFHPLLRDRDTIVNWRPGAAPALVPADDPDLATADLALLAIDEPATSPVAQVTSHLARLLRQRAHLVAEHHVDHIAAALADDPDSDCHWLTLGALPAPRPAESEPAALPALVRRAGWLEITERRDVLAHRVARTVRRWDGGQDWPIGATVEVHPARSPTAARWIRRLVPATAGVPPTVVDQLLLDQVDNAAQLLHDPETDLPAVAWYPSQGRAPRSGVMLTIAPQRLSTIEPLEAVTLSGGAVWVHTADGGLWPAPQLVDHTLGHGDLDGGAVTLAQLLDQLLDDITAPAVDHLAPAPPRGLLALLCTGAKEDVTYSRARLLRARSS
ncbi:hypothetical protein ABT160_44025 [Streptomyces sp. NPDC001941]|uniref:hypothetical protein n=1 Tax=Streptomyces sp. NPDC001941 TaxID=3154659 RepID=UPI00332AFD7A